MKPAYALIGPPAAGPPVARLKRCGRAFGPLHAHSLENVSGGQGQGEDRNPHPPSSAHVGEKRHHHHHHHHHDRDGKQSVLARARATFKAEAEAARTSTPASTRTTDVPGTPPSSDGSKFGETIASIRQELREQRALLDSIDRMESSTDAEAACSKTRDSVHPGTECTTRTTVREDTGTVTIEAQVRQSRGDGGGGLCSRDGVALAALAASNAAKRVYEEEAASLRSPPGERHRDLCRILQHGKIVSSRRSDHESEFFHQSFLVELECPETAERVKALFKPRSDEGEQSGWHRVGAEWVAYQLNLLLGMDNVPPTVMRKGEICVDGQTFEEGSFTYFVEGARQLNGVEPEVWSRDKDAFLSNTRILDVLIHNSDRHHGHFLYGPHWAPRGGRWETSMGAFLIDHAAGFRKEACVRLDHENAFLTGPTRVVSARTYLHLRYLTHRVLEQKLGAELSLSEICELNRRKDAVLDYFDGLVFFHGYDAVVVD